MNFPFGDYVLEVEPNLPRGRWATGKVTQTYPGADGLVRVVTVETASGVNTRPIHRLFLLELVESNLEDGDVGLASGENGAADKK
jgi:hypothetical protein